MDASKPCWKLIKAISMLILMVLEPSFWKTVSQYAGLIGFVSCHEMSHLKPNVLPYVTHEIVAHEIVTHEIVTHEIVTHEIVTHEIVTHEIVTHEIVTHEIDAASPLQAWSSGIVSACHRGDWRLLYGSRDRIPPGSNPTIVSYYAKSSFVRFGNENIIFYLIEIRTLIPQKLRVLVCVTE
jgi:hypothetical protein